MWMYIVVNTLNYNFLKFFHKSGHSEFDLWPPKLPSKSFYPGGQLCQQSQHSWDILITRIRSVTVDSTIAPQNKELFCVLISVKMSGGRNISERRQLNCSSLQDETWASLTHHPSSPRYNAAALAPAEHCRDLCASLGATANNITESSTSTYIHSCDSTRLPPNQKEVEVVEFIFQIGVNVSHGRLPLSITISWTLPQED